MQINKIILLTGSSYSCVAIALERYLGICFSHLNWHVRKSRFYILGIFLIVAFVDTPRYLKLLYLMTCKFKYSFRFLELETLWNENGEATGFTYSKLRKNKTYLTVYTLWYRLITTAILPFILMFLFNLGIICYYRKNR